jgi:ATP-dependent DNA helicase RecG
VQVFCKSVLSFCKKKNHHKEAMRNTYKYSKLYSGRDPQFIEGDIFRTIVRLAELSIGRVGPQVEVTTQDKTQVETHDGDQTIQDKILAYCSVPRSKVDIMSHCGYAANKSFTKLYLRPLLDSGLLKMTIPEKPTSRNQKYVRKNTGEQ